MLFERGMRAESIKLIQRKLNVADTGYFGKLTEDAVITFQRKNNLVADGIVGVKTWNLLFSGVTDLKEVKPIADEIEYSKLNGTVIPESIIKRLPIVEIAVPGLTKMQLLHFITQTAYESAYYHKTEEDMNYTAERLLVVFKRYFKSRELALAYAHCPEKIANLVYANRIGNGDTDSGDGWRYRGRGYIQLTFKYNYMEFEHWLNKTLNTGGPYIDILNNPSLVATEYALESAIWFFSSRKIWSIVNRTNTIAAITDATKLVTGGNTALTQRISLFNSLATYLK